MYVILTSNSSPWGNQCQLQGLNSQDKPGWSLLYVRLVEPIAGLCCLGRRCATEGAAHPVGAAHPESMWKYGALLVNYRTNGAIRQCSERHTYALYVLLSQPVFSGQIRSSIMKEAIVSTRF